MTQTDSTDTLPVFNSSFKVVVRTTGRVLFQGNDVYYFLLSMKDTTYRTLSNLSIVKYNS
jgi:hypothetical protein